MIKSNARVLAKMLIAATPCCPVASVRRRLQASGIERPQQRPGVDMWVALVLCSIYYFHILTTLVGEESTLDGAQQAAPPGVVHIGVGAAWRSEEAACRDLSCNTRSSRCFSKLDPTLQTIFTPFFVVQFHAFPPHGLSLLLESSR